MGSSEDNPDAIFQDKLRARALEVALESDEMTWTTKL